MTQVVPLWGQEGDDSPEITQLPTPNDPKYQLAVMLGILHGDKYRENTPPADQGYGVDNLSRDLAGVVGTQEAPAGGTAAPIGTEGGVLGAARKYLGIQYVYGGTNPQTGLDCSGFVQRAFADIGVMLPRVTYDQVNVGTAIGDRNELRAGDLIFFTGDGNRKNGHVGIYVGNGIMMDAPRTGMTIGYRKVNWDRMTAMRRVT